MIHNSMIVGKNLPIFGEDWVEGAVESYGNYYPAYGNGKYVCATFKYNKQCYIAYSSDLIEWSYISLANLGSSCTGIAICFGGGKFVIVCNGTDKYFYSLDGITWVENTLPYSKKWTDVAYFNGKFIVIGTGTDIALVSSDGITWQSVSLPVSATWLKIVVGENKILILNGADYYLYSSDLENFETWVFNESGYKYGTYGGGKFVLFQDSNSTYSIDGITWETKPLPSNKNWLSIAYGGGKFVVTGANTDGTCLLSKDAINWESVDLPNTFAYQRTVYSDGKFLAMGNHNSYIYSEIV